MRLFKRIWRVTVGTLGLEQIDVQFRVKKTLKPLPNTCELKIYNLTADHRKQIEQQASKGNVQFNPQKIPVRIEAGYVDPTSGPQLAQIFLGELRAGQTVRDGPEVVTELSTGDGEKEIATARLNVSFGPGTSIDQALREIVKVLGVNQGNINTAVNLLKAKGLVQFSVKGQVLKGNAADHLSDFCKGAGLEWSIQDGSVQILTLGQPLQGQALLLDDDHGLAGSPSVDSKGILSFTALMIPGLRPGVLVSMNSENVKGGYRVVVVEYEGDTMGNDWYAKCQAEKY